MNWALFGSTFALIFLAELGDKTQLAVMSQSAASSAKWTVFAAGASALITSTAIGVLAGDLVRRFVPDERYIKCAGGVLFLIFGGLMLREVFFPRRQVVAAPACEISTITDWMGRFVIQQAATFERAVFEDSRRWRRVRLTPRKKRFLSGWRWKSVGTTRRCWARWPRVPNATCRSRRRWPMRCLRYRI